MLRKNTVSSAPITEMVEDWLACSDNNADLNY